MKNILNKWQWELALVPAYEFLPKSGMYRFRIGIFKFKSFPHSGVYPSKKNIAKGFLWQFTIRTFKIKREI